MSKVASNEELLYSRKNMKQSAKNMDSKDLLDVYSPEELKSPNVELKETDQSPKIRLKDTN